MTKMQRKYFLRGSSRRSRKSWVRGTSKSEIQEFERRISGVGMPLEARKRPAGAGPDAKMLRRRPSTP